MSAKCIDPPPIMPSSAHNRIQRPIRSRCFAAYVAAGLLLGTAALHGSGSGHIAAVLASASLPTGLTEALWWLFLLPTFHMAVLAVIVILSVHPRGGRSTTIGWVALSLLPDAALGFHLGGALPGGLLLAASVLLAATAYRVAREQGRD